MMKSCLFLTAIIFATIFNLSFVESKPASDPKSSTEPVFYSRRCGIWENCDSNGQIIESTWDSNPLADIFNNEIPDSKRGSKRVPKWRHSTYNSKRRCGIWNNCNSDGLYGQRPDFVELTVSTESTMSTVSTVSEPNQSNGPYWEHFNPETSVLPNDAIIGGYENETLYIIRAAHKKSLTPGKYIPSQHKGYIPWGFKAHEKNELEILRGNNYKWVQCTTNIPKEAVVGGNSEHYHDLLYVCRGRHLGYTIPGKIDPHYRKCYIPYDGEEVEREMGHYEVLVVSEENSTENQSVHMNTM